MNAWVSVETEIERRGYGNLEVIIYAAGKGLQRERRFEIRDRIADRFICGGQGFAAKSSYISRAIDIALRSISGAPPLKWVADETLTGIRVVQP